MAKELDAAVEQFRARPLDQGPCTFVIADALVAEGPRGRPGGQHARPGRGPGVNGDGHSKILGPEVTSADDGAGWLTFLRDLIVRGMTGVKLVTSNAHSGPVQAMSATLPGAG